MGSKKLKKRKVKCKKLMKSNKAKKFKGKEVFDLDPSVKLFSKDMVESKVCDSQLNNIKYFNFGENNFSKIKNFVQMREQYFIYLQKAISENCFLCNTKPDVNALENISLKLEQHALLASLQSNIYISSISEIINNIKKCTQERKIHEEVRALLAKVNLNDASLKSTPSNLNSSVINFKYSNTCCVESDSNSYQQQENSKSINARSCNIIHSENLENQVEKEDIFSCSTSGSKYLEREDYLIKEHCLAVENNILNAENLSNQSKNNLFVYNPKPRSSSSPNKITEEIPCATESSDIVLSSLDQLQRSVETTQSNMKEVFKQFNEERERAYIAHILEGQDSDDRYDLFSETENDFKENINKTVFEERVEKMRDNLTIQENNRLQKEKYKLHYIKENQVSCKHNRNSLWRHEKIIQQFKLAMVSSEMSTKKQFINKTIFLELFGEDSDSENESEYKSQERYRASCTERISSWVVKYLMPYYHEKRIIGRNIFKSLGHHICDAIIDEIHYPDEWTVKYFISKFFPEKKKYVSNSDIIAFQLL